MKNKTIFFKSGFTLIELLVVISIIAILTVVGVVLFTNVQKSARDSRRKADINAISKAYETKYSPVAAYQVLANSDFAGGIVPIPPEGGNYYSVTDGSGFKTCAKLESYPGNDQYCNVLSNDCFCKRSTQGNIQSGVSLTGNGSEIGTGETGNLVTNSSFESGSAGWGFFVNPGGGASGTGSVSTERAYFGSSSYKIIDTGGTGEVAIAYGGLVFVPGQKYRISAWIYSTTPRGSIQGHFGGGWGVDYFLISVPSNKLNQWYQLSFTRVAGGAAPSLRCGAFYNTVTPGTVYCDGVVVEAVP